MADQGLPDGLPLWQEAHRSPLPGVRPDPRYRLEDSRLVFGGRLLKVFLNRIRLPNGHEARHELLLTPGAVSIVPVLEETPGRPEVLLVDQFRSTVEGHIHEIPAGTLDPGEEPLACARRELLEETGYEGDRWTALASVYPTPGIAAEKMFYFLAEGLRRVKDLHLDPGECLEPRRFPLDGLLRSMVLGEAVPGIPRIVDAKTYIGILWLGARRGLLGAGSGKEAP